MDSNQEQGTFPPIQQPSSEQQLNLDAHSQSLIRLKKTQIPKRKRKIKTPRFDFRITLGCYYKALKKFFTFQKRNQPLQELMKLYEQKNKTTIFKLFAIEQSYLKERDRLRFDQNVNSVGTPNNKARKKFEKKIKKNSRVFNHVQVLDAIENYRAKEVSLEQFFIFYWEGSMKGEETYKSAWKKVQETWRDISNQVKNWLI